jgi:hypothetical protein
MIYMNAVIDVKDQEGAEDLNVKFRAYVGESGEQFRLVLR